MSLQNEWHLKEEGISCNEQFRDVTPKEELRENIEKEELSEEIPEESSFETKSVEEVIEEILSTLPRKEMIILKNRFGFEGDVKTLKELSTMLKSNINIIRCYENRALRMLRHPSRSRELREYY